MNKTRWIKIAKGAGIAAAGAVLAYLANVAIPMIQAEGTGWLLTAAAIGSVLVNAARKYLEELKEKKA